jgi:hypothetical protein
MGVALDGEDGRVIGLDTDFELSEPLRHPRDGVGRGARLFRDLGLAGATGASPR